MTEEDEKQYIEQLKNIHTRLVKRNEAIAYYREKINTVNDDEIDKCIKQLNKLKKESKLDTELCEDIQNMIEVEHFLEFGNGRTFDPEY